MINYKKLLDGRKAVVTGGASGYGRAAAILFAKQGATVAIIDDCAECGEKVLAELKEINPGCAFIKGDSAKEAKRVCAEAVEALGGVDVLANMRSLWRDGDISGLDDETLDEILEANVTSSILCAKYLVPAMKDGRLGNIVNLAPDLAVRGKVNSAGMAAAAGAIYALTRNLTMDYPKFHVKANCVMYPAGGTPLVDSVTDDDIAQAALYFASELSQFVLGEALPVDGGATITARG